MSVIDIVVIAILGVFAIIGFVKGFLNTLLSLFGNLASLALAIVIVKPCLKFFDGIFHMVEKFGALIMDGIASYLPDLSGTTMTGTEVASHLTGQGVLGKLISFFIDRTDSVTYGQGATDLVQTLQNGLGGFAATVVTVIVMFILIRIAIFFLSKIFDAITKKTAIGGLDRILGIAFGAVKGALAVFSLLSIAYSLSPLIPQIDAYISDANFARWIYGYVEQVINWAINTVDWKGLLSFVGINIG